MSGKIFGCKRYQDKVGVLVAQLGTPESPTPQALYPYLKEFLSDPRVIEANRLLWWFVLNFIVLPRRPKRSARLYSRIWTDKGSPLMLISREQTAELKKFLDNAAPGTEVELGMRYGKPSIAEAIQALISRGCRRIVLFNMYPQYSAATTGTNCDAVFDALKRERWMPTLRVVEPYYDNPEYIAAQAALMNEYLARTEKKPERIVLSYHGIPQKYVAKGDPYCCQCTETTKRLFPLLNFPGDKVIHTYQSRFGRDPWLTPYTDETIARLAQEGVKKIAVACPGFTADCLETLDELGNEGSHLFKEKGGKEFDLMPCLNTHPRWLEAMGKITLAALGTWSAPVQQTGTEKISCGVEGLWKEVR